MRWLALWMAAGVLWGAEDPREIVRRSIEAQRASDAAARNYTFIERQESREFDGQGNVKRRQLRTFDVTLTEGTPYKRLIARDDKPLSPQEEQKEREKLQKSIEMRQKETPEQRKKRLSDWENRQKKDREFLAELPEAFDFRVAGEEGGAWLIEAAPRPGFKPRTNAGKFLPKFKGRLWIGKQDYAWTKMEAEVIDTVSFGWFLARVQRGTRFLVEQTRVNGEVWLPKYVKASAAARIALLKKFAGEWEVTYRDYKKFQSDSRVVSFEDAPRP